MTEFEKNTFELKCKLNCEKRWMTLLAKKNEDINLPLHYYLSSSPNLKK